MPDFTAIRRAQRMEMHSLLQSCASSLLAAECAQMPNTYFAGIVPSVVGEPAFVSTPHRAETAF